MINASEDLLICDFAETYHIYDLKSVPLPTLATLAVGLRDDSRIKTKISGLKTDINTVLIAGVYDYLRILVWQNTKSASNPDTMPEMIAPKLAGIQKTDKNDFNTYSSADDFCEAWERINKK